MLAARQRQWTRLPTDRDKVQVPSVCRAGVAATRHQILYPLDACGFAVRARHRTKALNHGARRRAAQQVRPLRELLHELQRVVQLRQCHRGLGAARVSKVPGVPTAQRARTLSRKPGVSASLCTLAKSLRSAASSAESTTPTRHTTREAPGRNTSADHQPARSLAVTSCEAHKAAAFSGAMPTVQNYAVMPHLPAELRCVLKLDANHGAASRSAWRAGRQKRVLSTPC